MSRRQEISLTFEALEPKILLAGNVEVERTGAGLKVTGDVQSNAIEIRQVNAETVVVHGIGGTTINGSALSPLFALGKGNVKLNFAQDGNDTVYFISAGPDLELSKVQGRFGAGNDEVYFINANTAKQVGLKLGAGENVVDSRTSSLRGRVTVQAGQDNDVVSLLGGGVEVLGKTRLAVGEGQDIVVVSGFARRAASTS